jgi:hypothetical protein
VPDFRGRRSVRRLKNFRKILGITTAKTLSDFQVFNYGVVACRKISQTAKDFSQATKLLPRALFDSTIPLLAFAILANKIME